MLSLLILTTLLSISACSHMGMSCCKKQACATDKQSCSKKKESCDKRAAPDCHKEVKAEEEQKKS
jgi:hypothetical protein